MPKVSGMNARERKLAERIAGSKIGTGKLSDRQALAVGFVIERRKDPTVPLVRYLASASADDVRAALEDQPPKGGGNK